MLGLVDVSAVFGILRYFWRWDGPFIVHSKRGNPILVLKGYRYSLKVTKPFEKTVIRRWQCSTHTNRGCLATIITHDQHIVKMKNEHNHVQSNIRNVKLNMAEMLLGFY
ncbi:unnamed protein product [Pieris brassicae]|uniref:FLYWCH-type domain-containing protein n=1 Tax=Pieris brassicae TaxID=7116 RepID=A0A9P0WZP6_PIEBR|nr:unnamed protein product [Pieris brassicae]